MVGFILKLIRSALNHGKVDALGHDVPFEEHKKRVRIVVVDDESSSFPTEGLRADGYAVDWWESINLARLKRIEQGDFDIVILDIQGIVAEGFSSTGDGLGVLRRIKENNPNQIVVAFSGQMYSVNSVPFFKLADDVLKKPVAVIECKELLDRLIKSQISVRAYWQHLTSQLRERGVSESRLRVLESEMVLANRKGKSISLEAFRDTVGTIESLHTTYGWVKRIAGLWQIIG